MLAALGTELPILEHRSQAFFSRTARELLPLVCNWEADAIEDALENVYARASDMTPELLSRKKVLGIFDAAPSPSAREAFMHSVTHSSHAADRMFDQVGAFGLFLRRSVPLLRRLLVDLKLETGSVRAVVERHRANLQALDNALMQRARAATSEAGKKAIGELLVRSTTMQQRVREVGQLCATASELHAGCEAAVQGYEQLLAVVQYQVEPAWERVSQRAAALQNASQQAAVAERKALLKQARAEFDAWLEETMKLCHRLREASAAVRARVERLQPDAAPQAQPA